VTHAELIALGAPPLPEGYFYRVEKRYINNFIGDKEAFFHVSIHRTVSGRFGRQKEIVVQRNQQVSKDYIRWVPVLDDLGMYTYHEEDGVAIDSEPIKERVELSAGELVAECAASVFRSWEYQIAREEFANTFDPYIGDHKC